MLKSGGSAVDAAVAVQMVLGLVEPQSSGIGGGAFMLYRDAATGKVVAYDGRETAPAAATENYLRYVDDATDQTAPKPSARSSGRSIGTPGVVRMLELAHKDYGKTAWPQLFNSGIDLASKGFPSAAAWPPRWRAPRRSWRAMPMPPSCTSMPRASRWRWAPSSSTSPMPTRCAASPQAVPMPSTVATWPRPSSARWA